MSPGFPFGEGNAKKLETNAIERTIRICNGLGRLTVFQVLSLI